MPLNHQSAIITRAREAERPRQRPFNPQLSRPLPETAVDRAHYSVARRAQCLTLQTLGLSKTEINRLCSIPPRSQDNLWRKAKSRGFNSTISTFVLESYLEDSTRSGRLKEIGIEVEDAVLANVRADKAGREKSSEVLTYKAGISLSSALRILKKHGLRAVKLTRKPGLTKIQKAARLQFCLNHVTWTLEDWKKVIFTDETSVCHGHQKVAIEL